MLEASKTVPSSSSLSSAATADVYFNVAMKAMLKSVRVTLDTNTNDITSLTIGMVYALATLISIMDTTSSSSGDDDNDNQTYLITRFLSTKGIPLVTLTPTLFTKLVTKTVGRFVLTSNDDDDSSTLVKDLWNMMNPGMRLLSLPSIVSYIN